MPSKNKILIIDDSEPCHSLVKFMLHNTPFSMIGAYGLHDAISIIRDNYQDICLIISDIIFPKTSGQEILNITQSNPLLKNIPFAFQSGVNDIYYESSVPIIYKPYNRNSLMELINKLVVAPYEEIPV